MSKRVAILLDHSGINDSRVSGQAETLLHAGYDVCVFCLNSNHSIITFIQNGVHFEQCYSDEANTIPVLSKLNRKLKSNFHSNAQQRGKDVNAGNAESTVRKVGLTKRVLGSFFSFGNFYKAVNSSVKSFQPDIIHANDLNTLPAGARLAKELNCRLVYDSHEYEYDRNDKSVFLEQLIRMREERRSIKNASQVITVSDSIADALQRRYKISRPHVVLNFPTHSPDMASNSRATRNDLGLPQNALIGLYIGGMMAGRGLEQAIESLRFLPLINLAVLGSAPLPRIQTLRDLAIKWGVQDQLYFLGSVEAPKIGEIAKLCDFGWIPIQNTCESYNFSLPNKLFQIYESDIPIFSTPLHEIQKFIAHFGCGLTSEGFDARSQADTLEKFTSQLNNSHVSRRNSEDYSLYSAAAMKTLILHIYSALSSGAKPYNAPPRLPHLGPSLEPT